MATLENWLCLFLPIILFVTPMLVMAFCPFEFLHKEPKKQDITMLS